ncbi:MAG TPA: hypothetical protein VFR09_08710, partial [Alphaproteobacteria bacterium]|nr:hypothetical protein [Alphaproteobacteria bacterium]
MTDRKPPELFAERPVRSDFARTPRSGVPYAVRRVITIIVLMSVIGGGLYWKFGNHAPRAPGEIPTIQAEGAYKQRPEEPGGLEIPHQDVQVYQALDNKEPAKPEAEHMLPGPETPTAPPAQGAAPKQQTAPDIESLVPEPKKIATTATQPEVIPPPAAAPTAPVAATPAPAVETPAPAPTPAPTQTAQTAAPRTIDDVLKDVDAQKTAPAPAPAATAPATASVPSSSSASGTAIQVAAVQDQATAQSLRDKLQTKYASEL